MKEYLQIVLPGKKIMTKLSFKSIMEQLPEHKFIQVHKSWVVAIAKIKSIERNRIKNANLMPVGNTFKEDFYRKVIGRKV